MAATLTRARPANTAPPPLSSPFWQQVRSAASSLNRESRWESLAATPGFDPNEHGGKLFRAAIRANDIEVCRFLLTHGAKPGLLDASLFEIFQPEHPLAALKDELAFARQREWLCQGDIRSAGPVLADALLRGSLHQIDKALRRHLITRTLQSCSLRQMFQTLGLILQRDRCNSAQLNQYRSLIAYPVLAKVLALKGINTTENSHWQRRMAQRDEGLRLWLKNTGRRYFSRTGKSDRNHNGKVSEAGGNNQPFTCRHMVMAYNSASSRRAARAQLASRARMAGELSWNQLESAFKKAYHSAEQHLVPCKQFDRFLRDQFGKMQDGKELRRQFVIVSLNHAMHLTLECKYGQYALSLYDPNSEVDSHLRLNRQEDLPKHVTALLLENYSAYFPGFADDCLMAFRSDADTPKAAPQLTMHQSDPAMPLSAGAWIVLSDPPLPSMIRQRRGPETPERRAEINLWFRELAVRYGASISDFVYFIATDVLRSQDLNALLQGRGPKGISILDELLAKQNKAGLVDMVAVFSRAQQTLTVSPAQARTLARRGVPHSAYQVK